MDHVYVIISVTSDRDPEIVATLINEDVACAMARSFFPPATPVDPDDRMWETKDFEMIKIVRVNIPTASE